MGDRKGSLSFLPAWWPLPLSLLWGMWKFPPCSEASRSRSRLCPREPQAQIIGEIRLLHHRHIEGCGHRDAGTAQRPVLAWV